MGPRYLELYRQFDPPYEKFDNTMLGAEFAEELETVSRLWFACGYQPGIASYLNFFILKEFIVLHDEAFEPRFRSFRSMGESFYQTDLFVREVTDSGLKPSGGISSKAVRDVLGQIMARHQKVSIPGWMMTYFGFSLMETVEKQCAPLSAEQKRLHLAYMAKTYRIMGLAFSQDRGLLESFSRAVEEAHARASPNLEKHARNILLLGEMVAVPSNFEAIAQMLPEKTWKLFKKIHPAVRPGILKRIGARIMGRVLMKQAIGKPRKAVPVTG